MTDLLIGCRAKIERANENIKNLNSEVTAYFRSEPPKYQVVRELQKNGREYVFTVFGEPAVPLSFAVSVGEIVRQLHSSLDHLFCALVMRNGKTVEKRHYFPIYSSRKEFEKACAKGLIEDISPSAQKIIGSIQPCFASKTPTDTPFYILRELKNLDEHRELIIVAAAVVLGQNITLGTGKDAAGRPPNVIRFWAPPLQSMSNNGVKIFAITFAEPLTEFEAHGQISAQIAFPKIGLRKDPITVIPVLGGMARLIAKTADEFASEF